MSARPTEPPTPLTPLARAVGMVDLCAGETCDPCAEKGIPAPAVADAPLYEGGPWAYLCRACAYRRGVSS